MIPRPVAALALAVLAAHLALSYSHNLLLHADDDRLWLYVSGARIDAPEAARELDARVRQAAIEAGAGVSRITRLDLRAAYHRNYAAPIRLYRAAARTVRDYTDDLWRRDYPAFLARAMYAGFVGVYVLTCAALIAAVAAGGRRWMVTVAAAVAAIALLETVFDLAGDTWSGLPTLLPDARTDEGYWENLWPNVPAIVLNPQVQLSPFGDTPRNHFNLLAVAVFVLRWRGRHVAAYVALAALGFVHQSHTALLFASLVAADALLRPHLFRTRALLPMLAVAVTFVSRESLGALIGIARPVVIVTIAALATLLAAALWLGLSPRMPLPAGRRLAAARDALARQGDVAADLIVIGSVWVLTFPVAAAINALGTTEQSQYFWTQIHGRWLGILRPSFIVGGMSLALDRLARRRPAAWRDAVLLSALALLPSAYLAAGHDPRPISRLEREAREVDLRLGETVEWNRLGAASEQEIYYAEARALDRAAASR